MLVFFEDMINHGYTSEPRLEMVAVPISRIYQITTYGKSIAITYNYGEYDCFGSEGQGAHPESKVAFVTYSSEYYAREKMREFYDAAANNQGAFQF